MHFRNPASSSTTPAPMLSYTSASLLYQQQHSEHGSSTAIFDGRSSPPAAPSLSGFSFTMSPQPSQAGDALVDTSLTIGSVPFSSPSSTGGTFPAPVPLSARVAANRNRGSHGGRPMNGAAPASHPSFMNKTVCTLRCRCCSRTMTKRGMRAILLADTRVELFSTDAVPRGVQLVADDYRTQNCQCRIRDIACEGCGNVCGYHVVAPCEACLNACNNGHFWMLNEDAVSCSDRLTKEDGQKIRWSELPPPELDLEAVRDGEIAVCR